MKDNELKDIISSRDKSKADSFIKDNLSASQAKALNDVLADKKKLNELLNSEKAKSIIEKFFNKE